MNSVNPFQLLQDLDARSQKKSGLLCADGDRQEWTGVLFRIGEDSMLAPMSMLDELVHQPPISRVPGVKPWVLGLANLHNSLLPVIDLQGFLLGTELGKSNDARRLLVVSKGGQKVGLLVAEVFGMKQFWMSDEVNERPPLARKLQPYVSAGLKRFGEHYAVFDLNKLLIAPEFLDNLL
ncbi:MAG: chemotaxis protein CheW [Thiothrix sp.]|nr:MAG: chemotaxis protein CheW [Thiothrix sp.]